MIMTRTELDAPVRYRVTGMDCSSCAAKIEGAARKVAGVQDVRVSIASQEMTLQLDGDAAALPEVERTVTGLSYKLARLDADDNDDKIPDLSHVTPRLQARPVDRCPAQCRVWRDRNRRRVYRGLAGPHGGRLGLAARAKAALLQSIFLGLLGVGVLIATAYRVLVVQQPEAELMGILGLIALGVNVAAAVVLIPHRHGDANARAVWLFSRNDAIGNIAVVIAALAVAGTQARWPDLIVAVIIAGLFLQSSFSIIRDARKDLSASAGAQRAA